MFNSSETNKEQFLETVKTARLERAQEKRKESSVILVQSCVRRWLCFCRLRRKALETFDELLGTNRDEVTLKPAIDVFNTARMFLFVTKKNPDSIRMEILCKNLVKSLESKAKNMSYVGLALTKQFTVQWVTHIKSLLAICCQFVSKLRPEFPADTKALLTYLHTLVSFTGTKTWVILHHLKSSVVSAGMNLICNTIVEHLIASGLIISLKSILRSGLCRNTISLKHATLSATMRLTQLALKVSKFSDKMIADFLVNILSVPGLILHLQHVSPECLTHLSKNGILEKSLNYLNVGQNFKIVFHTLETSYALCLAANLIHLAHTEREKIKSLIFPTFTHVVTTILMFCRHNVIVKQSNLTHWHPILGWFSQEIDPALQEATQHTKVQLHLLFSGQLVEMILGEPLKNFVESLPAELPVAQNFGLGAILKRNKNAPELVKMDSPDCVKIAKICALYERALAALSQIRLDVLTGICYQDRILYHLWRVISQIGFKPFLFCGLRTYQIAMLILFCDCMTHYLTILDDLEMYEQQDPFKLDDFATMSNFCNQFLYKGIVQNFFDLEDLGNITIFNSMHTLLLVLFKRDCRRPFTAANHWLIKEIRASSFLSDLEKGKKAQKMLLQKMPHILPQMDRVRLFKKLIETDKENSGLTESASLFPRRTHITVHRSRIVEDGYRQLAALAPLALKGIVRVHFVNEQGLNEAGVDQDGVFKEETVKRVFDPGLNLFRATSEQRLYPSPSSYIVEDYLNLFEFIGKILGKAVYEGIVVDVPFASFFLSQILGQPQQALYSSMDELPSLDAELYQSLTFIKHTDTNVADLDLTFSVDMDHLGRIVTRELLPGGRAIPVTNQNKISYIHLMAHFRMHTQIREQTAAFIKGFRSIINPEWLWLFSTPELQRLISGDNVPIDLKSLRKHTQYFGGFHDTHRIAVWLWDILEKDFSEEEKRLFLKFVTSCSKPPLLGFAHLEPPFSIRCVEVSDDDDPGDTVGSIIRGFFTIRKKDPQNRLPTSSTCFNLLKLPNYQKKSTLREKLRYAISSNTGFELS